jgi:glutamate/tyrosine decarboxylase-like PLP-dependent enzyme
MQGIKLIIDPRSGWPDITIYSLNLMIELKSMTAALSGEHYRNQVAMHHRLKELGWRVHVCRGAEEAKEVFKQHLMK